MNQEIAFNEISQYICDMRLCESYRHNCMHFEWSIYAAEKLQDKIIQNPNDDPISLAKRFKAELEDYATTHEFAQKLFGVYASAINDILECYLY